MLPYDTDRRCRHNGITDPVDRANQDSPDGVVPECFHGASHVAAGGGSSTGIPSTTGYSLLHGVQYRDEPHSLWINSPLQIGHASNCNNSGGSIISMTIKLIGQYAINVFTFEANYTFRTDIHVDAALI